MTDDPKPREIVFKRGYQPRAGGPVDPAELKPPRGGSAIELPRPRERRAGDRSDDESR